MLLSPLDEEEDIGFQANTQQDVNQRNYEGLLSLVTFEFVEIGQNVEILLSRLLRVI